MADTVRIEGVDALVAKFGELRDDMRNKTGKRAIGAAATVVRNQARTNIDAAGLVKTGTMKRNTVFKYERKAPEGTFAANVGVRHGRGLLKKDKVQTKLVFKQNGRIVKKYVDDPFYWRFHEKGTAKMAATPFLEPALKASQQEAVDAMSRVLDKAIIKQERSP